VNHQVRKSFLKFYSANNVEFRCFINIIWIHKSFGNYYFNFCPLGWKLSVVTMPRPRASAVFDYFEVQNEGTKKVSKCKIEECTSKPLSVSRRNQY